MLQLTPLGSTYGPMAKRKGNRQDWIGRYWFNFKPTCRVSDELNDPEEGGSLVGFEIFNPVVHRSMDRSAETENVVKARGV